MLILFMTFFMIVTLAAVSDELIAASDNNFRNLLLDLATVIEQEAKIAQGSENGYFHSFTLPQTLNGLPYTVGIISSDSIGGQANITIIFVASANQNIQLNVTKVLPRDVGGTITLGPNTVKKVNGKIEIASLGGFPVSVSDVNPATGSTLGGTVVSVTGSDFEPTPTVLFDGTASPGVTYISSGQLNVITPAHPIGIVDVTVTNPSGASGTKTDAFTYIVLPPPTVTSFSPGIGPSSGGTAVTITGTNFVSGASVTFGGVASPSVTFINSNTLQANTPSGPVGFATVSVINPDLQSANAPSQFLNRVSPVPIGTVFVTSLTYNGNLGGLAGGDNRCQALADAGSFGGTWSAWLSTNTPIHAKDRITDTQYALLDSRLVANSKADLTDGSIANRIDLTDSGAVITTPSVWTGTASTGNYAGGSSNFYSCVNWGSQSSSLFGRTGSPTSTTTSWTTVSFVQCSSVRRLYCFRVS